MKETGQRDTPAEIAIRSRLYALGFRYLVDSPIPGTRSRPDIVFRSVQVAVFVDGCFWHGCPIHGTWPKSNAAWWRQKIEANRARDKEANQVLSAAGWEVVRIWAHEDPDEAALRVTGLVRRQRLKVQEVSGAPRASRT